MVYGGNSKMFSIDFGIKTKFLKSSLIRPKGDDSFMGPPSSFLKCKVGSLPFTCLIGWFKSQKVCNLETGYRCFGEIYL